MIECRPDPSWVTGRYRLAFSSAAAEAEWNGFARSNPEAAKRAYERLTAEPLTRIPRRQFSLKGKNNKPFWEYEATGAGRIYYAADIRKMTVIIAARNDVHSGPDVGKLIRARRTTFDDEIRLLAESAQRLAEKTAAKQSFKKKKTQAKGRRKN